ncbi:MAG: DUF4917 family protein [Dehalococcoidia bacterium]|nr:DUF4917 family protein [Dehalococcoidia bacterium]
MDPQESQAGGGSSTDLVTEQIPSWLRRSRSKPVGLGLATWGDLRDQGWREILLGNGFSIGLWPRFAYGSLFGVARDSGHLSPEDARLFEEMETADFERGLSQLLTTAMVLDVYRELDARSRIGGRYAAIQKALLASLRDVHPRWSDVTDEALTTAACFLRQFARVYSTNYDLLLYWTILRDKDHFRDFFWRRGFDSSNTEIWGDATALYYLHGAVFLSENTIGEATKIVRGERQDLLTILGAALQAGNIPLFVSEGASRAKVRRIRESDYLSFCHDALRSSDAPLVVYGSRLGDSDEHITRSIHESPRSDIAVGLYTDDPDEVADEKHRIGRLLAGKRLAFFDSRTLNPWAVLPEKDKSPPAIHRGIQQDAGVEDAGRVHRLLDGAHGGDVRLAAGQ